MYLLKMYVTGHTQKMANTIEQVRQMLRDTLDLLEDEQTIEIIDVLETPQRAIEDKVFATPTLVKVSPQPSRRIVGDLSNSQKVSDALDLLMKERN